MRLDCKGISKEIKKFIKQRRKVCSPCLLQSDVKILLVLDIGKKKSSKRNISVLITLFDEARVTKNERRKPDIHKLYDHTEGGRDVVDLISTSCTTRIKKVAN